MANKQTPVITFGAADYVSPGWKLEKLLAKDIDVELEPTDWRYGRSYWYTLTHEGEMNRSYEGPTLTSVIRALSVDGTKALAELSRQERGV